MKKPHVRPVSLALGLAFLVLGALGVVVPLLPATPFLLAASFFLARGSGRVHRWFSSIPWVRTTLERMGSGQGLPTRDKVLIWLLAAVLLTPVAVLAPSWHLRVFIVALLVVKGVFLWRWKPGRPKASGPHRGELLVQVLASVGGSLVAVALYGALAWLVTRDPSPGVWALAGGLLVVKVALTAVARARVGRVSARERVALRQELMGLALAGATARTLPGRDHGHRVHLIGEGVDSLALYRGLFTPQLISGLVTPFLILALAAWVDPFTALVLALIVPLTPLVIGALQGRFRQASARYREVSGALTGRFLEAILGLATLKTAGASRTFGATIDAEAQAHRRSALGLLAVNQLLILVLDFVSSYGLTLVTLGLAVHRYQAGILDGFAAAFLVLMTLELVRPQQLMGAFFFAGGLGRATLAQAKTWRGQNVPDRPTPPAPTEVVARGLRTRWGEGPLVGVEGTVVLTRGVLSGLRGPSGSGKTTWRRMVTGLVVPVEGTLEADGHPVDPGVAGSWFAVADQAPYVFSGTLRSNLLYADPGASDHRLRELLDRVGLGRDSGLTLDTPVGEEGRLLSGGQRSRLSLVRALLSPAPFLILDEPSADLDPSTEALVLAVARDEATTRGVLVISHRPALLSGCSRVFEAQEEPVCV